MVGAWLPPPDGAASRALFGHVSAFSLTSPGGPERVRRGLEAAVGPDVDSHLQIDGVPIGAYGRHGHLGPPSMAATVRASPVRLTEEYERPGIACS